MFKEESSAACTAYGGCYSSLNKLPLFLLKDTLRTAYETHTSIVFWVANHFCQLFYFCWLGFIYSIQLLLSALVWRLLGMKCLHSKNCLPLLYLTLAVQTQKLDVKINAWMYCKKYTAMLTYSFMSKHFCRIPFSLLPKGFFFSLSPSYLARQMLVLSRETSNKNKPCNNKLLLAAENVHFHQIPCASMVIL